MLPTNNYKLKVTQELQTKTCSQEKSWLQPWFVVRHKVNPEKQLQEQDMKQIYGEEEGKKV